MRPEMNTVLYNLKGVDIANVNAVADKILKTSKDSQATVQAIDYSKFNRNTLGIDLYSKRTAPELQRQIALTQAGLYAQAVNTAKLNAMAAANLYSAATVQRNVSMAQSVAEGADLIAPQKLEENQTAVKLFNISDKNPGSHNGFNPFSTDEEETTGKDEN